MIYRSFIRSIVCNHHVKMFHQDVKQRSNIGKYSITCIVVTKNKAA